MGLGPQCPSFTDHPPAGGLCSAWKNSEGSFPLTSFKTFFPQLGFGATGHPFSLPTAPSSPSELPEGSQAFHAPFPVPAPLLNLFFLLLNHHFEMVLLVKCNAEGGGAGQCPGHAHQQLLPGRAFPFPRSQDVFWGGFSTDGAIPWCCHGNSAGSSSSPWPPGLPACRGRWGQADLG